MIEEFWNAPEQMIFGSYPLKYFTIVDENIIFKNSETHQNEGFFLTFEGK